MGVKESGKDFRSLRDEASSAALDTARTSPDLMAALLYGVVRSKVYRDAQVRPSAIETAVLLTLVPWARERSSKRWLSVSQRWRVSKSVGMLWRI
jgi:hypothetical protein